MRLVDTHCHIDLYPDFEMVIEEIEKTGIATIAVTNIPSVFHKCVDIAGKSKFIKVALGLHPELVVQRHREIDLMLELMSETRFIGEVGLDFVTKDQSERTLQCQTFEKIITKCALYGDKILTIHSRRAGNEVVDLIGPNFPGKIILHWYSGTQKVLEKALTYGFYFSVNPSMFRSESGRKIIALLPQDRILTESDGPFVSISDKPIRPADIITVISDLSGIWEKTERDTADILYGGIGLT